MTEPLRRVADNSDECRPGEFFYRRDRETRRIKWLEFWPCDCPVPLAAAIAPQRNESGASWTLSGPENAPTLHPSMNAVNIWHGWLKNGVATKC